MKNMKGYCLMICLWAASIAPICAQQIYQSHHFGGTGTEYLYNRLFAFDQDSILQQSGADITWDLSAVNELNTHISKIATPGTGIDFFTYSVICGFSGNNAIECATIWANTQQAWFLEDTITLFQFQLEDLKRYQRKTQDLLLENFIGFNVELGGQATNAVIVYQRPDTILHFPVVYGDSFSSDIQWNLDLSPTGQNIQYGSHQTRTTAIDGWGTLITPHQTYENVVRMRSVIHRQDSISTDSFSQPLNLTQVEYMWLDTNYKLPVMQANGFITDTSEVLTTIELLYDSVCESPTWSLDASVPVYYLDETGTVTIDFVILDSNADIYDWDWGIGEFDTTTGDTSHTFTGAGMYSVGITGCMLNCLPLNSCAYDIYDFVVLDTITSVQTIDGATMGIQLLPNPVQERMHIVVPEDLDIQSYEIYDIHGKRCLQGALRNGINQVLTDALAEGIYTVLVQWESQSGSKLATMRFAVMR